MFREDDEIFGTDENDDNSGTDDYYDIFGTDTGNDDGSGIDDKIFGEGPATGTPGQCGKRNNEGLDRISDLEVTLVFSNEDFTVFWQSSVDEANFGEWPHVCAVLKKEYVGEDVSI